PSLLSQPSPFSHPAASLMASLRLSSPMYGPLSLFRILSFSCMLVLPPPFVCSLSPVPSLCLTSLSCVAHNCTSPFPICMRCPAFAMHMLSICQPRQLPAVALSFVDRHWSGSSPGTVRGMAWVMGELVTACAAGGAEAGRGAGQQTAAAAAAGVEEGGKAVREALLRAGAVWAKQWSAVPAEHGNGAAELYV
ncbi:unnamed protein product, partial [Closterium sp. Naga37s-1]